MLFFPPRPSCQPGLSLFFLPSLMCMVFFLRPLTVGRREAVLLPLALRFFEATSSSWFLEKPLSFSFHPPFPPPTPNPPPPHNPHPLPSPPPHPPPPPPPKPPPPPQKHPSQQPPPPPPTPPPPTPPHPPPTPPPPPPTPPFGGVMRVCSPGSFSPIIPLSPFPPSVFCILLLEASMWRKI